MHDKMDSKIDTKEFYVEIGKKQGLNCLVANFLYQNLNASPLVKLDKYYYEINARLWTRLKIKTLDQARKQFILDEERRKVQRLNIKTRIVNQKISNKRNK